MTHRNQMQKLPVVQGPNLLLNQYSMQAWSGLTTSQSWSGLTRKDSSLDLIQIYLFAQISCNEPTNKKQYQKIVCTCVSARACTVAFAQGAFYVTCPCHKSVRADRTERKCKREISVTATASLSEEAVVGMIAWCFLQGFWLH